MNTENLNIPRKNSDRVKEILATDKTNSEKADSIFKYHEFMLANESSKPWKNQFTVHGITLELDNADGVI